MILEFEVTSDGVKDVSKVELVENDCEVLRNFLNEYDRLMASGPMQKDIPCGLNFSFTPESGPVLKPDIPSSDDIAILLHRLRPFLLQSEPHSFHKATAVFGKRLTHRGFRALLTFMHELWRCERSNAQMPVILNNSNINTEEVLIQWLNATEYHRDHSKAVAINRLRAQVPAELFDYVIVGLMLEKLRAVIAGAKLASLLVGHLREVTFNEYRFVKVSSNSALQPTRAAPRVS